MQKGGDTNFCPDRDELRIKLEDSITRLVEGSKSQLQDEEVHEEIVNIIEEHDHKINQLGQDDIKRIFWNQQVYYLIVMSMKQ
jgi:hypothetical protein